MTTALLRRELLTTAGAGLALTATAGQRPTSAEPLAGGIKITMPVGELTEEALAFVAYLGVEFVTTGGPASPTYTPEGRVVQARPNDPPPPWKDADLRRTKETVERAGLKIGNLMLHDFRRAILGRPGADEDIELVKESIRAAGRPRHSHRRIQLVRPPRDGRLLRGAGPRRLAAGRARLRPQP